ncbi:hypothetical protein [Bacillus sp. 1P06AnD]|uniref:hypothetical protein n=1 Tax=Bacillus sp. 1P06AnD TaxID=3132208 RepID=UPI0039A178EA
MNKRLWKYLHFSILPLALASIAIIAFIIYTDWDSLFPVVLGCIVIIFLAFIYVPILIIFRLRHLSRQNIRKRILIAIAVFVLYNIVTWTIYYFKEPAEIDLMADLIKNGILAMTMAFFDLFFFKKGFDENE